MIRFHEEKFYFGQESVRCQGKDQEETFLQSVSTVNWQVLT